MPSFLHPVSSPRLLAAGRGHMLAREALVRGCLESVDRPERGR
jgi:hypothetical protein